MIVEQDRMSSRYRYSSQEYIDTRSFNVYTIQVYHLQDHPIH
jgi:hypothetical protein